MAELFDVYEATGALIGAVPISPLELDKLHNGQTITIMFHTPRMLRDKLGERNGVFEVLELDGKLFVTNPDDVKRYIELQKAIEENAKSNSAVR